MIGRNCVALAAIVLAAAALCATASLAGATRTVRFRSHISIGSEGLDFGGRVRAGHRACLARRRVVLLRLFGNGDTQVVGRDRTDARGRWSISVQGSAGITLARFFARVKRRRDAAAGTVYVCKAARSRAIKPAV